MEQKLNMLATRKMTREAMVSTLDRLFPATKSADGKPVETTRRTNILGDILKLYESNDGNQFPEQRGTAYNLLNAVTEYTDHYRSARNGERAESAMFGSGDRLKTQTMEVLMETAKGLQEVQRVTYVPASATPARQMATVRTGGLLDSILSEYHS